MYDITAAERKAIASASGVDEQYLYQCLTGRRKMPALRCPEIELASAGRVTCEQLRPDVMWVRVEDDVWPNVHGRPLIDATEDRSIKE